MKVLKLNILFLLSLIIVSCGSKKDTQTLPEGYHAVVVQETKDADKYTYMRVKEGNKDFWIASEKIPVANGDTVYYSRADEMKNFKSKTLDKTFESIYFVNDISKEKPSMSGNTAMEGQQEHPQIEVNKDENIKIEPVEGGYTIQQIYDQKDDLAGKTVKVKGKVTKFNESIMNRNWVHIQDGTNSGDNFDLLITTPDFVKVGDIITAEGVLAVDKDFGAGYKYDVVVEDAKIMEDQAPKPGI